MKILGYVISACLFSACVTNPPRCPPLATNAIRYDIEHPESAVRTDAEWKDAMIVMESIVIDCWQGGGK